MTRLYNRKTLHSLTAKTGDQNIEVYTRSINKGTFFQFWSKDVEYH